MPKPFEKNDSRINRGGRPKGKSNRSVEELRKAIHEFVDMNFDQIQKDFDSLEPIQRLNFLEKLLAHVMPKPITSLNDLSSEDLQTLLDKLRNEQAGENTGN